MSKKYIEQQFTQSRQLSSKFNHSVILFYNDNLSIDITSVIKEIKSVKYCLGQFASAELILLDREKRVHNLYYFNNGNKVSISINNINDSTLYFEGQIYSFQAIELEEDLYLLKIWSIWDSCNLKFIRKGFTGFKKISEIITETVEDEVLYGEIKIFNRYKFIEETSDMLENFIIPGWNLQQLFDYMIKYSRNLKDDTFLFFEDNLGINFISRSSLYEKSKYKNLQAFQFMRNQKYSESNTSGKETIEQDVKQTIPYNVIYEYELVNGFDAAKHNDDSDFGINTVMFDYATKSSSNQSYEFSDEYKKIITLTRNSIIGDNFMKTIKRNTPIEYTSIPSLKEPYSKFCTLKSLYGDYSLKFRTNFKSELNVGDFIRVDLPALIGNVDSLSGVWMIGEIEHRMEISEGTSRQPRLSTYITAVRDSMSINRNMGETLSTIRKDEKIIEG